MQDRTPLIEFYTQTDRLTDKHAERQADGQTGIQTDTDSAELAENDLSNQVWL